MSRAGRARPRVNALDQRTTTQLCTVLSRCLAASGFGAAGQGAVSCCVHRALGPVCCRQSGGFLLSAIEHVWVNCIPADRPPVSLKRFARTSKLFLVFRAVEAAKMLFCSTSKSIVHHHPPTRNNRTGTSCRDTCLHSRSLCLTRTASQLSHIPFLYNDSLHLVMSYAKSAFSFREPRSKLCGAILLPILGKVIL